MRRRKFIDNTVKLAVLGTVLVPIQQACNNKKNPDPGTGSTGGGKNNKPARVKKNRKKWLKESMVLNTKTGVMHLPTAKVYHYYDEIKEKNRKEMSIGSVDPGEVHFHKAQSGNILELVCLRPLAAGVNDENLNQATNVLAIAFSENCNDNRGQNLNEKNFRLHELLLQLVSLNSSIPAEGKWQSFASKIKKPAALRKRQQWMASEIAFNERVKYIADRRAEYEGRLVARARKYSFT